MRAVNRQRHVHTQRRERAQRAGNHEVLQRGLDAAARAFAGEKTKRHREQAVAAQRGIDDRLRRALPGRGDQEVRKIAAVLEPEVAFERGLGAIRQRGPARFFPRGRERLQLPQQPNPEHLNLHRITLARRARGIIRVHPREVARAPDKAGFVIDANAVGRAAQITLRDFAQHVGNRATAFLHGRCVKHRDVVARARLRGSAVRAAPLRVFGEARGGFLAHNAVPKRRVGGVAVRRVLAVNRVGQRAVLHEAAEDFEQLHHVLEQSRGEQTARANQRIAAPIEKPRITRDDRFARATTNDECVRRERELPSEVIALGEARGLQRGDIGRAALREQVAELLGRGVGRVGVDREQRVAALRERDFKPARTERVARALLAAALFNRVREIVRPLGFVMVSARVRPRAKLPLGRGREGKARALAQRVAVRREVVMRTVGVFRFRMKIAVLDVEANGERDPAFIG